MDCMQEGDEAFFTILRNLGEDFSSVDDNFDDVLKDPLLPWSVGEPGDQDMLQDSFSDIHLLQELTSSQYSDLNSQVCFGMLDSDSTPASQGHDTKLCVRGKEDKENFQQNDIVMSPSSIKIEGQDLEVHSHSSPELLKLLKKTSITNVSEAKLQNVQSTMKAPHLLPIQSQPAQSPPQQTLPTQQTVPVQPIPIQPVSLQRPKIMISPQPSSSLQLYSILPNQNEEPRYPVVTLPSYQPSKQIAVTQVTSSNTSQQIPVQQLILHAQLPEPTAASLQRPFQIVIDSSKLPVTCSVPSQPVTVAPPKERHRAHNAIEKKYRTSINDKITEMKNLLFGTDAKIQKSGVLKKAIDHIKHLRNTNTRLRRENMSFKMKLQQLGALSCVKSQNFDEMESFENIPAPLTPESIGDGQSSSASSSSSPPSSPCKSEDCYDDKTRLGVCIIMFAFFIFDPFNLVFSWHKGLIWERGSSQATGYHGRLLMSQQTLENQPQSFSTEWFVFSLLSWVLRSFVIGLIFLKVFVFGEPFIKPDSKVAAKFWAFKRQADLTLEKIVAINADICRNMLDERNRMEIQDEKIIKKVSRLGDHPLHHLMPQGDYIVASKVLGRCLETLGRPLPTSRLDVACSLLWNMFRHMFHRLWIGKWLTTKALQYFSFRSGDKKEIAWRQQSAKEAALIYHKLHHLYLTGHVARNSWFVTVIALNAVNLAEMAEGSLSEEKVVEIYIDVAIQFRSTFPKYLQFLARYFRSRARSFCRGETLPYSCWWLFTPLGHRFFVNGEWNCKKVPQIWNSSKQNENKPLVNVTQTFSRYLLEQALSSLLLSQNHGPISPPSTTGNSDENTKRIEALDILRTLTECANNARKSGINRNLKVFGEKTPWSSQGSDVVCCWWTAIGNVAACWLVGDIDGAKQHYKIIENIPEEIENNDDPIGKGLLMAFKARSQVLGCKEQESENIAELLEYCDNGGALLRESIAFASLSPPNNLLKLMHLLCCDWLLSTRSDIWEKEALNKGNHAPDAAKLDSFDKDLKSLQKICCHVPEALPKVYMYQATCRMIAGASPLQTRRLLQRSVMCQRSTSEQLPEDISCNLSTEKDRACALMMASTHLPTSLFSNTAEHKGLIFDAVESLQKIGEKDRVTRCRKLLLSI